LPNSKVFHLETDGNHSVVKAHFYNIKGEKEFIEAAVFTVAGQAIESSRLLLMSKNKEFPDGLANNSGQVGKNLIFSAGGTGWGHFYYKDLTKEVVEQLKTPGLFVNRSIHHWYEIDDAGVFGKRVKGGIVDFLFEHSNSIRRAIRQKWDDSGNLVYGSALKKRVYDYFTGQRRLNFEVFCDWLPNDNCFVTLSDEVKDKWDDPVARIRIGYHPHDLKVGAYLATKAEELLKETGARDIGSGISGSPPPNLVAGGCRFGTDPASSVLDVNCKAHEVNNLYVTDGSFMPTGGSITYTWTIYANAFRVADKIIAGLNQKNN
jgi:choline dehydrogenase-like flavoprotein